MKILFVVLVMFIAMNASGQWQSDYRLTYDPIGGYTYGYGNAWSIGTSGNNLHVVWHDFRNGNWDIYYKRSTDGGINWGADIQLTNDPAQSDNASIAVSVSNLHVVWHDNRNGNWDIYYKRSTDGGSTWEADTRLTNDPAISYTSSVTVSGSNVHVVWKDTRDGNEEIYYKRSTNGGLSWDADMRLTNNSYSSSLSSITVSGSVVNVVWQDKRDENWEIYYKRSTDGGAMWDTDTRLTSNPASSTNPSIAVSGSIIHVVWYDTRDGNEEIYYKHSINGGLSWDADIRLTNNSYSSSIPNIAVSGTVVHVVWQENIDGNDEIFYKRSTNGGTNWEADTRLTNNGARSILPSISVVGSRVNVVWTDTRNGGIIHPDIYYKLDPTGNPTEIQNISTDIYLDKFENAQKAYNEGKYLLVIDLLKDFPIDNAKYNEAVALMNQAIAKIPNNSNQTFVTVSGIINCGCSKPINGYVVFEDMNTRSNVGRCRITSDGSYFIVLPTGKTYSYYIDSKDFYPVSRVIDFTTTNQSPNFKDNINIVTYEEMKEKQTSVRINNIFFDFNESKLKSESYLELDRLYKFLNDNPAINIEVSGHTDNVGSDEYNQNLSLARANTVKDYLTGKGINAGRITSKGYGKSNPVATNDTDEGRQLNRRVEFKILKK